jgi:hypothetical protein
LVGRVSQENAFGGAGFPQKCVWWGGFHKKMRLVWQIPGKARLVGHAKRKKLGIRHTKRKKA